MSLLPSFSLCALERRGAAEGNRAILIHAASIGYDLTPDFVRNAPGQKHMHERIAWEVRNNNGPIRRAIEAEGLWDFWEIKPKAKL